MVKTLREALGGNRNYPCVSILNGTCNYILTRMADEKLAFEPASPMRSGSDMRKRDPTFDIDGFDTAHKLSILTSQLDFGTKVDAEAIYVEGIRSLTLADLEAADELGYKVKLLGVAVRTEEGVEQRVHPTMVPKHWPIAQVSGVTNAVAIDGDAVALTLVGRGGGRCHRLAVEAIFLISRRAAAALLRRAVAALCVAERAPMQHHEGCYYIRLSAVNKPGTAATIARRMADEGISLESIVQRRPERSRDGEPASVILITYATTEAAVRRAVAAIDADGVLASVRTRSFE